MISRDKCILLGTFVRTHGVQGSLLLRAISPEIQKIKGPGSVFVETDGLLVPFFMISLHRKTDDDFIIDLEDVDTTEKAARLKGSAVFYPFSPLPGKKKLSPGKDIRGYKITDKNSAFTGKAEEIIDASGNMLLRVNSNGKEYLVPFHRDIVIKVNHRDKIIVISAPEGLFDL
jgi:16S rRNA processing protein RimM